MRPDAHKVHVMSRAYGSLLRQVGRELSWQGEADSWQRITVLFGQAVHGSMDKRTSYLQPCLGVPMAPLTSLSVTQPPAEAFTRGWLDENHRKKQPSSEEP